MLLVQIGHTKHEIKEGRIPGHRFSARTPQTATGQSKLVRATAHGQNRLRRPHSLLHPQDRPPMRRRTTSVWTPNSGGYERYPWHISSANQSPKAGFRLYHKRSQGTIEMNQGLRGEHNQEQAPRRKLERAQLNRPREESVDMLHQNQRLADSSPRCYDGESLLETPRTAFCHRPCHVDHPLHALGSARIHPRQNRTKRYPRVFCQSTCTT